LFFSLLFEGEQVVVSIFICVIVNGPKVANEVYTDTAAVDECLWSLPRMREVSGSHPGRPVSLFTLGSFDSEDVPVILHVNMHGPKSNTIAMAAPSSGK